MTKIAANDNSNIIPFQPREALVVDGMVIPYEKIDKAFMEGQLNYTELCKVLKKFPHFHRWFIFKHRQVFV